MNQDKLKTMLSYDPETGLFTWRYTKSNRQKIGTIAGNTDKVGGYVRIFIDGRMYQAHNLASLYMTGKMKKMDHKNRIRNDNRWDNLRECTLVQNNQNTSLYKNNTSGVKGVSFDASKGKYKVYIGIRKKVITIGFFKDFELAELIAHEARDKYFQEFKGA